VVVLSEHGQRPTHCVRVEGEPQLADREYEKYALTSQENPSRQSHPGEAPFG
jgi:hypothetical protein